jgi:hypothetical protein
MAENDSTTTIEGRRPPISSPGLIPICLMCRREVEPGENLCPNCTMTLAQVKEAYHQNGEEIGKALGELRDLAADIRGLAKSIETGKVPGVRRIKRIARDLSAWENWLNSFILQINIDAVRYGRMQQLIH